ncbi:MAG: ribosome biogenesis GTPase Der [Rickettsiaceae bacterium H1]|nr:ribosome biogenesis GTPase Der [Rickettsiaceae bacterium H1]
MFKVAILGCPNVGKSTLFNELVRGHKAVVYDKPGVTRDYNEGVCDVVGKKVIVIDSPGWGHKDEFSTQIQENILRVLQISNLVVLVVEPEISAKDKRFSLWLRKNCTVNVILAINKCEKENYFHELGWKDRLNISAKHCMGLGKLREKIASYVIEETEPVVIETQLKLAIVGRPNVGKSTLINSLLQENRVIVSAISGTTRDAIEINWQYKNRDVTLIDTAGMRKKSKVNEVIESSSVGGSIYSIRRANVVILVLDATRGFENQDLSIVKVIVKEGKPIIPVINKCDLAKSNDLAHIKYCCSHHLPHCASVINISAIKNKNCNRIIDSCLKSYDLSLRKIPTAKLNEWLINVTKRHEPPLSSRKTLIKLKFISQISNNPFTFKIFANIPEDISKSYLKYLTNDLSKQFNLLGFPVKILLAKNHNPYI